MNKKTIIKTTIWVLFLAFVFLAIINFQIIKDIFLAKTFSPSPEIALIDDELNLTEKGHRIFYASAPEINDSDSFNENCKSTNEDISTLGCYNGQKIFIYNVESDELKGIKESTSAHELLHAVWMRLSTAEKENLTPILESVYEKSDMRFKKSLDAYQESAKLEEIYVRSATQIKNLPEDLEKHFSEIFKNQDKIVDFYDSYITPFNALEEEISVLFEEISSKSTLIDEKRKEYDERSDAFSSKVTEFNNCANTLNCFTSSYDFNLRRSELLSEQASLDELFDYINQEIKDYNEKVELYNSKVIHGQELNSIIDSKSKPLEEIK